MSDERRELLEKREEYFEAVRQYELLKAVVSGMEGRPDIPKEKAARFLSGLKEIENFLVVRGKELKLIAVQ